MTENPLPHPLAKKIRFSGNCPECEMKKFANEMLLNSMDFFECLECHLQVTVFPDAVTVLKWRGEGEFRQNKLTAMEGIIDQRIFAASEENEILPNKDCLSDYFDLEEYLIAVKPNHAAWSKDMDVINNFDFSKQEEHLESIDSEYWENLIEQWKLVQKDGIPSESFNELLQSLYDGGVIFNFPWQDWKEGLQNVKKGIVPNNELTLLDASKYLTVIYRQRRFDDIYQPYKHIFVQLFNLLKNMT
jgi:hypothetical protein